MDQKQLTRLVERSRTGDRTAQEELIAAVQNLVYFHCCKLVGDRETALDLTQEILITMVTGLPRLQEPAAFRTWLLKIVYSRCQNHWRRSPKECQIPETEEGDSLLDTWADDDIQTIPDQALDRAETVRLLRELVDGLPPEQRTCVLLYYYDELKISQIASVLSVPETTVKSRLFHARKALKDGILRQERRSGGLYSLALAPLMGWLLRNEAEASALPAAEGASLTASTISAAASATGGTAAAATTAVGTIVKIIACVAILGATVGGIWTLRDLRRTKPPVVDEPPVTEEQQPDSTQLSEEQQQPDPAQLSEDYVISTVLMPPEIAMPVTPFTFETPSDLTEEQLMMLFMLWTDYSQLEACQEADGMFYFQEPMIRSTLDRYFKDYDFDITQCDTYDADRQAVVRPIASGFGGDRDMRIVDTRIEGDTATYTVDFHAALYYDETPGTYVEKRKVYEIEYYPGGWYYLSAREVPVE